MTRHDETLLWDYASQSLDVGEAKVLGHHLEECPECREKLDAVMAARGALRLAREAMPSMQWKKVDERIGAVVERRLHAQAGASWSRWALGGGLLAAAVVAALVVSKPMVDAPAPLLNSAVARVDVPEARVDFAEGLVVGAQSAPTAQGSALHTGDVLRTSVMGKAFVHLPDASHLRLAASTQVALTKASGDDVSLALERGRLAVRASHQPRQGFVVTSGNVVVHVVGTVFAVERANGGVDVAVSEGRVRVETVAGTTFLEAGARMRFDAKSGKGQRLTMTKGVLDELAETRALGEADSLAARTLDSKTVVAASGGPSSRHPASLPRLEARDAQARQVALPPEVTAAPVVDGAPAAQPPGQTEVIVEPPPPPPVAVAPVVEPPPLPAPAATPSAESEWQTIPAQAPEAPPAPAPAPAARRAPRDLESIFLQRAEASIAAGGCERFLLGLEEIAMDAQHTERTEAARVLRARCFANQLRPRQALGEYRKYVEEYPAGQFVQEARQALGE